MLKVSYSDHHRVPLPQAHRFPMLKYELVREQLLYEGVLTPGQLYQPEFIPESIILQTHDPDYWHRVSRLQLSPREIRRLGFPQSPELVTRSHSSVSGTWSATRYALRDGIGVSLAGGTHHAYRNHGEGFCVLNDVAISVNDLLVCGSVQRVLIIDLDVHQGNGTAHIFADEPRVFTFSVHCQGNYPLHKEQSDLDVGLVPGTGDETFLQTLRQHLPRLFAELEPDIAFYVSGVDILATDRLGKLSVSIDGCRRRDQFVIEQAARRNIPLVVVMGGGYSSRMTDNITAHCNTIKSVVDVYG